MLIGALCATSFSLPGAPEPGAHEEFSSGFSPSETDHTSEFMVSTWKSGEGLPANEIFDLQETPDGYLWLGTLQGLVRFDGIRFETFFNTPTGSRYGTHIGPLEVDARGRLWFVPDQIGIVQRDAASFTEVLTNSPLLRTRMVSLCSDGGSNVFWVDANGGLGKFSIDQPNHAEKIEGVEASGASRLMRDFKNRLWLTDQRSLKVFEDGQWRNVPLTGTATFVAAPRRAGGMWITRDAKLRYVTANGLGHEVAAVPWAGQSRSTCLLEDSRQRLWIGTLGQGLYCYAAGEFKRVVPTASSIVGLLEDEQDNIWAGTRGSGLVRVRQRQFFMHNLSSGLKNEFVRSLSEDKAGRLWMTTVDGGLGWFRNGAWHPLSRADGWRDYDSLCVLPRNDGSVWVSTIHRGMWRWMDGQISNYDLGTNAPNAPAVDLLEDRQNRLWMVTDNSGISCLDGKRLTHYSKADGLPSEHIWKLVENERGEIWAGDWEGGLARLREKQWEVMRKPSGHADGVRCAVASNDEIWMGTSNSGLLRFKDGKTARLGVEQGLPDACVQQLLVEGGSLWGGTPHKLFRISLAQLNEAADGQRAKIDAIIYGRSDGLPDVSFASWSDPRCGRANDGELWFATANGAIHFQPENLRESKPPQVLLEQTSLDGKPIATSFLQHMRPGAGRLEFRFTAPCLSAPDRVRFRYQLTGVDSDWMDAGTARTATYTGIPSGNHLFRVLASSPEGVWNSQPVTVALAVHPYFWQTNWFIAAIAAACAGGGVWIIRRATVRRLQLRIERLHEQRAMDRERARIAQDIHDELGANLTSIGLLADMGVRHKMDSTVVTREFKQISQTARESVVAMDAIVWALNPRNDSLDNFANYVAQFTREFFRPTPLRTRLNLPANLPTHRMSTETRHQLLLLVKESFNNIVRHADATEVNLELACENGHLRLTIADNGKGLSEKTIGEGHDGLANLRERIERLGGTLQIETLAGAGTKFEFTLPTNKLGMN